ncbi:hypothetical protein RSSM_04931 [Rhodopirellula sallentina SM41]|uniref:Uncharacterized protein n=1 Tax=Rhodopirellula sallentina SM41 TaxID=1263870 RepID=M5U6T8_9BACT|nr:hypothetical protein RSSM_04931 [Rhodopirellula sallentina SM41]
MRRKVWRAEFGEIGFVLFDNVLGRSLRDCDGRFVPSDRSDQLY